MSDRKVFQDSVVPLPDQPVLTSEGMFVNTAKSTERDKKFSVLFALEISPEKQMDLEQRVIRGEVLSDKELNSAYTPSEEDVTRLTSWLQDNGFQVERMSSDRTSVYASATVSQIEKALEVEMVSVTKDGLTYTAAKNAPSLPADVGSGVHTIIGLQPFRRAHKNSRRRTPSRGNRAATVEDNADALVAAPNIDNAPPYLVSEILKAYAADGLDVTGAGQTIAILIDTFPADSDVRAFWERNGIDASIDQVQKVNVRNVHLPAPEGEETLDVCWASGIAPGANVRVYASGSLRFLDLDLALDRILDDVESEPGMRQLSISLGLGEAFMGGPLGEVAVQHNKFVRLAAKGVNVFVSSGDAGSNPDVSGHSPIGPTQVEYEASDPFVVGVGGTSLKLASDGSVASETAWVGSGGGRSIFFSRPSWQAGEGMPAGSERLVPDVSLAADPETGAFLVFHGSVTQIGGTSWSAPVWAGFCALANEARAQAGKSALPFLTPLLYPLIGTSCFRDVRAGTNGAFEAGDGYDLVTGIGTPNVRELIDRLVAQ